MELLIPNLIPPHQDESIYSYAYRLSRANGHTNLYAFLKSLQTGKEAADFHANWTYDGYRIFAPLLSKLEPETRATIIQNCSYYPFHAVFLTTHQQAIIVDRLFNNIKSKKSARKATIITQKNACKKCMEEDWENHGHYYMHRSHSLPGVTVCYKHHIPLNSLTNGKCIETTTDAVEYAEFSAELLSAGLETDIDMIWQAAKNRMPSQISGLTTPLEKIIKDNMYTTRNQDIPNIIRVLLNIFGSVHALTSCLEINNETTLRFAKEILKNKEYDIFQPFSRILIQARHKTCGETFFTTPDGFMTGWKCPVCNKKTEDTEPIELQQKIKALTGEEYTVLQIHNGQRNTTAEIRHNPCGTIKTYDIKHFLTGLRCPNCTTPIPASTFPELVQYKVTKQRGKNRYEITEETGWTVELTPRHFLQEILRPTPSEILPIPVRSIKKDWIAKVFSQEIKRPSRISSKEFLSFLTTIYDETDLIFIEDLHKALPKEYKHVLLGNISRLYKTKQLHRVGKGIYSMRSSSVEPLEILKQRNLVRKGKHIGIYNGKSLAYEIGILKQRPNTVSIMSNTVSSGVYKTTTPTYKCTLYGLSVSFTTSPVTINDENYQYLMVLQALRYCNHYGHEGLPYVTRFVLEHNLSHNGFKPLLPYYTKRIQNQLKAIMEELCGKSQMKEN